MQKHEGGSLLRNIKMDKWWLPKEENEDGNEGEDENEENGDKWETKQIPDIRYAKLGKLGNLWYNPENEKEETKEMSELEKQQMEREIAEDVFHSVILKSLGRLKEVLQKAANETGYEFDGIYELFENYVRGAGYNDIIRNIISRLNSFQTQYSGEQANLGFEAEIITRAIENLRRLTNELVVIIGSEDKELPLTRLVWNKMITSEEEEKFEHELTPETIKEVLTKRPVVNYKILQQSGPDLKVIWE